MGVLGEVVWAVQEAVGKLGVAVPLALAAGGLVKGGVVDAS